MTKISSAYGIYIVEYISPAEMRRFAISVCLTLTYLPFAQYWNVVESLYLIGILSY